MLAARKVSMEVQLGFAENSDQKAEGKDVFYFMAEYDSRAVVDTVCNIQTSDDGSLELLPGCSSHSVEKRLCDCMR